MKLLSTESVACKILSIACPTSINGSKQIDLTLNTQNRRIQMPHHDWEHSEIGRGIEVRVLKSLVSRTSVAQDFEVANTGCEQLNDKSSYMTLVVLGILSSELCEG
jgi:hypothetical protein